MAELGEEHEWIRQSQQGDHAAFEALITRHQRMIHSLTFRMTGSLAEAEDLAQETFIQAFRQANKSTKLGTDPFIERSKQFNHDVGEFIERSAGVARQASLTLF